MVQTRPAAGAGPCSAVQVAARPRSVTEAAGAE